MYNVIKYKGAGDNRQWDWIQSRIQFYILLEHIWLIEIRTGDRHAKEIENNITGILRGAKAKFDSGIIAKKEYNEIRSIVSAAEYEAFFPMLYIIESEKVKNKCIEVSAADRASDSAVEYKVEDLTENEFEPIFFKDILDGIVEVVDKKVGESYGKSPGWS